nr:vesicle-associated protein 4-1 isoform X2 [Arachis hypogaea]
MAIAGGAHTPRSEANLFRFCPFWSSGNASSSSSSLSSSAHNNHNHRSEGNNTATSASASSSSSSSAKTVSAVARSLFPPRRRLRLDPSSCLYFPYEPGKQVRSAVRLKNTSKSYVAFKFQTTAPKSCYMRPPGGIIAPGESLIATVFKFVEQPENNEKMSDQKNKVKFKIMSLKVKEGVDYVPELPCMEHGFYFFKPGKDNSTQHGLLLKLAISFLWRIRRTHNVQTFHYWLM